MKNKRRIFEWTAKLHIWLGWLVGIPLLFWTVSGLFMVSQPIEKVRGEHLKTAPAAIAPFEPVVPALNGRTVQTLTLVQQSSGPTWLIDFKDGSIKRADAKTGKILPTLTAIEASNIANAAYAGNASLKGVTLFAEDKNPVELRRGRPAWQAKFSDDTHIYVDADTGAVLATRSDLWRTFDFMWGLHIMDLQEREDTSHPILIFFAALSLVSVLFGLLLLFRRRKKRRANI